MKTAYLDNSATTMVCKAAADRAYSVMTEQYGNPSSLHRMGLEAERIVSAARETTASSLGDGDGRIIFTSGGTEANNLAVQGAAYAQKRLGKRIITTGVEHAAVMMPMDSLQKDGFEVVYLKPDREKGITPEMVAGAITKDTILISMMLVNNETGMIFPVEALKQLARQAGSPALIHCDAVQAYTKLPIHANRMQVDLLTMSGHKFHAPMGVGALYLRKGVRILPVLTGGGQEGGLRSGTENVPGIAGFGEAVREAMESFDEHSASMRELRSALEASLLELGGVTVNSPAGGAAHILNFSVEGYKSEALLHFLESRGIYVSSASACSSKKGRSRILTALGLRDSLIDSALRVSMSRYNTREDIELLVSALREAKESLARVR